ncbi:MAG: hypothetical protein HQK66_10960 [Desulfamplus sp.]|nr:hypothetical protein [Desulfamplus sp.]
MKRYFSNVVLLLLLAGLAPPAGATPLLLGEAPVHVLDQGELSLLQDPGRQMTLDDVRSAQALGGFLPLYGNLGLGYIPEAAWLHLDLHVGGASPVRRWLEVLPPYLDNIQIFHLDPTGKLDHRVGGDLLPQSAREEPYRAHLFKLEFTPGRHQIFIRLQTTSTLSAIVKLWEPGAFERRQRIDYFNYGMYFSLIFTVLLFNLVNGLVTRRPIFLVYVGYLALNALQWLAINGFVAEFLFPEQPLLANLTLGLSLTLAAAMAFVFFIMILELRIYHPLIYRIHQLGAGVAVLTAVVTPLGFYQTFAPLLFWIGFAAIILALGPIRRLWSKGDLSYRLLATAYLTYCVLITINILGVMKVLPFSESIIHAGMASNIFHILFLHFAILLNILRAEKAHALALQETAMMHRQLKVEQGFRREQGQLLDMLSHELKNPMATVRLTVDAMPAAQADHQRRGRIERALANMNAIVERCTQANRLEHASLEQHISHCDIESLVREVITTSAPGRVQPGRVQLEAAPRLPTLHSDPMLLSVAIGNLIDNAIKYSPPDSRVSITLAQGPCGPDHETGQGVRLTVRNLIGASGLPDSHRLYDKFYRGEGAMGQSGSGLGLYLAKNIAGQLGGRLSHRINHPHMEFSLWIPVTNT